MSSTYHSLHKSSKSPERGSIILHYGVDGSKQIAHALNVAQVFVVLIVCQEHIFHLLKVNIRTDLGKW